MNNVKSKSVEIELGAQLFKIEFDFNVLCEIQERYGASIHWMSACRMYGKSDGC